MINRGISIVDFCTVLYILEIAKRIIKTLNSKFNNTENTLK